MALTHSARFVTRETDGALLFRAMPSPSFMARSLPDAGYRSVHFEDVRALSSMAPPKRRKRRSRSRRTWEDDDDTEEGYTSGRVEKSAVQMSKARLKYTPAHSEALVAAGNADFEAWQDRVRPSEGLQEEKRRKRNERRRREMQDLLSIVTLPCSRSMSPTSSGERPRKTDSARIRHSREDLSPRASSLLHGQSTSSDRSRFLDRSRAKGYGSSETARQRASVETVQQESLVPFPEGQERSSPSARRTLMIRHDDAEAEPQNVLRVDQPVPRRISEIGRFAPEGGLDDFAWEDVTQQEAPESGRERFGIGPRIRDDEPVPENSRDQETFAFREDDVRPEHTVEQQWTRVNDQANRARVSGIGRREHGEVQVGPAVTSEAIPDILPLPTTPVLQASDTHHRDRDETVSRGRSRIRSVSRKPGAPRKPAQPGRRETTPRRERPRPKPRGGQRHASSRESVHRQSQSEPPDLQFPKVRVPEGIARSALKRHLHLVIRHDDSTSDGHKLLKVDDPSMTADDDSWRGVLFTLRMVDPLLMRDMTLYRVIAEDKGDGGADGRREVALTLEYVCGTLRMAKRQHRASRQVPPWAGPLRRFIARRGLHPGTRRRAQQVDSGALVRGGFVHSEGPLSTALLSDTVNLYQSEDRPGIEIARTRFCARVRYEFTLERERYSWLRVSRKENGLAFTSFHLVRWTDDALIACIVHKHDSEAERTRDLPGYFVTPSDFWFEDDWMDNYMAGIILMTGLIALVDDAIRAKSPADKKRPTRLLKFIPGRLLRSDKKRCSPDVKGPSLLSKIDPRRLLRTIKAQQQQAPRESEEEPTTDH